MLKKFPIPVCGLALGLASLGNLIAPFGILAARGIPLKYFCGGLSLLIILAFTVRAIADFGSIKKELENPVAFSVLPTYTMAIMLLTGYAKPLAVALSALPSSSLINLLLSEFGIHVLGGGAIVLWFAALALQLVIMAAFAITFVAKFNIKQVFPSWFVMFVGIVVASVTAPAMGQQALGKLIFVMGFTFYIALLPVVLYRVLKVGGIPEAARPTLAIFCAPASLCFVGYMSAFNEKNVLLATFIIALSITFWLAVALSMFKLLRLPFFPSYSAFTFPFVISATAFRAGSNFFAGQLSVVLGILAPVASALAAASVLYVLVRYLIFWMAKPGQ